MVISHLELLNSSIRHRRNSLDLLNYYIEKRLKRGKNVIIVIDGDTGSGKSTSSLSLASMHDYIYRKNPDFAVQNLTIFSAGEFVALVGFLLAGGEVLYRRRFTIFEEAGQGLAIKQAGAVREFENQLDVFRKWQINTILNLPDREDIQRITLKHAHFIIFIKDIDEKRRIAYGYWRMRIRTEKGVFFVNPYLAQKGIYDTRASGAYIEIPFCDPTLWKKYEEQKDLFVKTMNRQSLSRILRLANLRSDLTVSTMRPQYWDKVALILNEKPEILMEGK